MPFFWRRRKKFWYGRRRYRRRFQTYKRRPRRFRRYKRRRTTRRRRRRRKKVKRKKSTLIVRQWQPDSIVLCKIKGFESLCWGAQGSQFRCFSNDMFEFTRPKYPGGGGFGVHLFSLKYLYDQWKLSNNIWTKTNEYKDLARFLQVFFTFYRHPHIDFVIAYERQPPFDIDKLTYMNYHPYKMLQRKHKIILPSLTTNPRGKSKKTKRIRPPKQMITKWFFMEHLAKFDLVLVAAAACSLRYPRIGCCNENRMLTIYALNTKFYMDSNWAQSYTPQAYYKPYATMHPLKFYSKFDQKGYDIEKYISEAPATEGDHGKYYRSVSLEGGYFSPKVLNAYKIELITPAQPAKPLPMVLGRYNPQADDGKGNKVALVTVVAGHWNIPTKTEDFLIENVPLWLAFWGYYDFLKYKKGEGIFPVHMFLVQSPYIHFEQTEVPNNWWAFIDYERTQGKNPYDSPLEYIEKRLWYPTVEWQEKTINAFCSSGPYVPKLDNQTYSTWELATHYSFHFKWGGPQITDQPVEDPTTKRTYDVPDTIKKAVQIVDPTKNIASTMFHEWDYRRGCITSSAIKRMQQNLQTDSSIQSDSDQEPPTKKRRCIPQIHNPEEKTKEIQNCLLSLCEENTCQDQEEKKSLFELIQQQKQQQQHLKHNLLTLIRDLRRKQKVLQLQTGILE
nr:MAG: ORF1 [Torque teno midi virus]